MAENHNQKSPTVRFTRKDRSLKTVSDAGFDKYPKPGKYTACVKVVDVFGCATSITVGVKV